jgi:hypothetical protein
VKFRLINVLLKITRGGRVPGVAGKSPAVGSSDPRVIWKENESSVLTSCINLSKFI